MLHSESETSAHRNIMKFAAAAAAMAVLAGCAVAVPLPPLVTSSQNSRDRDFACRAGSKCTPLAQLKRRDPENALQDHLADRA
jgi:hypothetical protein